MRRDPAHWGVPSGAFVLFVMLPHTVKTTPASTYFALYVSRCSARQQLNTY